MALVTIEIREVYDAQRGFHIFLHINLQVDKRFVTPMKNLLILHSRFDLEKTHVGLDRVPL